MYIKIMALEDHMWLVWLNPRSIQLYEYGNGVTHWMYKRKQKKILLLIDKARGNRNESIYFKRIQTLVLYYKIIKKTKQGDTEFSSFIFKFWKY